MKRIWMWIACLLVLTTGLVFILQQGGVRFFKTNQNLADHVIAIWKKGDLPGHLTISYPLSGALFPPEIPPPTLVWKDQTEMADTWLVAVEHSGRYVPDVFSTEKQTWKPDPDLWNTLKTHSLDSDARITVLGFERAHPRKILSGATTTFRTSRDEVGAPVFYRDVPLPFIYAVKNPETIRWRLGDIASPQTPPVILSDLPVCGNCHSFSRDGRVLGMDVDYANDKGSYVITDVQKITQLAPNRIITWSDYRREDNVLTAGLLSQVSPDGRYVVSTVKDRSVFAAQKDLAYSQLFFPIRGILVVYDRQTQIFSSLSGADDPRYVHSNPTWSPDGRYLIFARAPAIHLPGEEKVQSILSPPELARDFIEGKRGFRYDLYRIPFNKGKGGTAKPVPGASNNGRSNYFPRISPDGKRLVFTMAKNFMLLQPDSKLYIMPVAGGTPREMVCNTSNMNSWHAWSPNGKWLVFSSKIRGPYTQLFLTHIDANGQDTPPVFLEYFHIEGRAINIPEFVNIRPGELEHIAESFIDDAYLTRQGMLVGTERDASIEDLKHSLEYYRRALEINPMNLMARLTLGAAYMELGKLQSAEQEYKRAIETHPSDPTARNYMALLYLNTQQYQKAGSMFQTVAKMWPDNVTAHLNLGMIYGVMGNPQQAEVHFQEVIRVEPENFEGHMALGNALEARGRPGEALLHYRKAIAHSPTQVKDCLQIAQTLMHRAELNQDIGRLLENLLRIHPECAPAFVLVGKLCLRQNDLDGAIQAFETANTLDPAYTWLPPKIAELKALRGPGS